MIAKPTNANGGNFGGEGVECKKCKKKIEGEVCECFICPGYMCPDCMRKHRCGEEVGV